MAATTINEVIDRLTEIVAEATAGHKREGYFAALYKKVTVAVAGKIKENYFDDNERMEKLDVVFANRFISAYDCYSKAASCSGCWQLAFDTATAWPPMVIHHLLLGMNAHISLDLGIATATVSEANNIEAIHNDFNKINIVLSDLIAEVKADLYSMWPLSRFITKLHTDKLENDMAGFSMNIARDAAWQVALAYAACNNTTAQEAYILTRDKDVRDFGNKLLQPGKFIQVIATVFRVFELGTISGKIKKLDEKLTANTPTSVI